MLKTPLRYWVSQNWDRIRIETDGTSNEAVLVDGESLHWFYGVPSDEVREAALNCLLDQFEHGVPGCEFVGHETAAQMDAAADVAEAA